MNPNTKKALDDEIVILNRKFGELKDSMQRVISIFNLAIKKDDFKRPPEMGKNPEKNKKTIKKTKK